VKLRGFRPPYARFLKERRIRGFVQRNVQEIRGISLVFREMWDTTVFNLQPLDPTANPNKIGRSPFERFHHVAVSRNSKRTVSR
jgi:hypothetical protein